MYAGHLDLRVPLAWTVDDAMTDDDCERYRRKIQGAHAAEVAPVITERGVEIDLAVRSNTRVMWDDEAEAAALLARVASSVPERLAGKSLVGANPRRRL